MARNIECRILNIEYRRGEGVVGKKTLNSCWAVVGCGYEADYEYVVWGHVVGFMFMYNDKRHEEFGGARS